MMGKREAFTNSEVLAEALALAHTRSPAPATVLHKSSKRSLTRRGVLWLGQTCNLKCEFCYFFDRVANRSHPEHAFMSLEKAQSVCRTVAKHYGNTAVDVQGGEPTLFPGIFELIRFCNDIQLAPTLITNALLLDDPEQCRKYREAGVRDFLVSVQGLGEVHDRVVGCPGAHRRQMVALRNLREIGIPFRFNVVMSKTAMVQLPEIAQLAVATGAFVVNFIAFNPFADQAQGGKRRTENVPRYSEVTPHLTRALDLLGEAGIEANVRYFPFCMVEQRHRKNIYNFQQLSYDPHEWDFASWGWTGLQPQRIASGDPSPVVELNALRGLLRHKELLKRLAESRYMAPVLYQGHRFLSRLAAAGSGSREELYRKVARNHAEIHCSYRFDSACARCVARDICDGFHGDYVELFGSGEAAGINEPSLIRDPCHYLKDQKKSLVGN